jgi:hypothetical protein
MSSLILPSQKRPIVSVKYDGGHRVALKSHSEHPRGVIFTLSILENGVLTEREYFSGDYSSAISDYKWEQTALWRRINGLPPIERK